MNAIILSAGFGTRMQPYTNRIAKPAIEFLTVPMLGYSLFYLEALELEKVVCNLHYKPETIKECLRNLILGPYEVLYSEETPEILDSAGGIKQALKFVDKTKSVIVMNGDTVCLFKDPKILKNAVDVHESRGSLATFILIPQKGAGRNYSALWTDKAGFIKARGVDYFNQGLTPYHYTGCCILDPVLFAQLPEGPQHLLKDVILPAIDEGKEIDSYIAKEALWLETGNPEDYFKATGMCIDQLVHSGEYARAIESIIHRFSGEYVVHQSSDDPGQTLQIDNVYIDKQTHLIGLNVIGPKAIIKNCGLKNCVVQSRVTLKDQNLENQIVF